MSSALVLFLSLLWAGSFAGSSACCFLPGPKNAVPLLVLLAAWSTFDCDTGLALLPLLFGLSGMPRVVCLRCCRLTFGALRAVAPVSLR
eukprot:4360846-Heterocapsa_arctica.AAC.1